MALTRNFKKTVVARVERDPKFAKALLDEAATLIRTTREADRYAQQESAPHALAQRKPQHG
jgi:hypothetical protein